VDTVDAIFNRIEGIGVGMLYHRKAQKVFNHSVVVIFVVPCYSYWIPPGSADAYFNTGAQRLEAQSKKCIGGKVFIEVQPR
jgi:hypothetical protein